ncbi:MAG: ATP-binding protein [Chloroflexota bacterium]
MSSTATPPIEQAYKLPVNAVLRHRARAFSRRSGKAVAVVVAQGGPVLPAHRAVHLAHAVDLALANVDLHAGDAKTTLSSRVRAGRLFVRVSDNGVGLDPLRTGGGAGLGRIHAHAAAAGARVWLETLFAGGTDVVFELPLA